MVDSDKKGQISVVIDEAIPFIRGLVEPFASVKYYPGREITNDKISDADAIIIRTRTRCNRSLLEGSRVSFIGSATIGYDHIDTDYCTKTGIHWATAPGCNSGSVQQYMVAALLHICSGFGLEPSELTVGIVGAGHVGSKTEAAARALGFKVLVNDPPRQRSEKSGNFVSLDKLTSKADIITLHVPLTLDGRDSTLGLAGKGFITNMKKGGFLINTSRGEVVNEGEVKKALRAGKLAGYIADVWTGEPFADRELIAMSLIATPHIAGYSADGKLNGTRMMVKALSDFFRIPLSVPDDGLLPSPGNPFPDYHFFFENQTGKLNKYISHTYDIIADSTIFKSSPENFESLRDGYPARREFSAFSVKSDFPGSEILLKLGFREWK